MGAADDRRLGGWPVALRGNIHGRSDDGTMA